MVSLQNLIENFSSRVNERNGKIFVEECNSACQIILMQMLFPVPGNVVITGYSDLKFSVNYMGEKHFLMSVLS